MTLQPAAPPARKTRSAERSGDFPGGWPLQLLALLAGAFAYRFAFRLGHVFTDDSHYLFLAQSLLNGEFGEGYLGYPVVPLRVWQAVLGALAFRLFGVGVFAASFFPMACSLANVLLSAELARRVTGSRDAGLLAGLLMAIFPTDTAFATIFMTDAPAALLINLAALCLVISYQRRSTSWSLAAGACLFFSLQFKMSACYAAAPPFLFVIWRLAVRRRLEWRLLLALGFLPLNFLLEAGFYKFLQGDPLFRFHQLEANYRLPQDFFTEGSAVGYAGRGEYYSALLKRVFYLGPRAIFLRRFYLLLPLLALAQSLRLLRAKRLLPLAGWFLGLVLVYDAGSSSLAAYQPLPMHLSWYLFPLFMPAVILSAVLLEDLKPLLRGGALLLLAAGSLLMCREYADWFNREELGTLRAALAAEPGTAIHADPFSAYALDFEEGYARPGRIRVIRGSDFDFREIPGGELVFFNELNVMEARSLGRNLPAAAHLETRLFDELLQAGGYKLLRRRSEAPFPAESSPPDPP